MIDYRTRTFLCRRVDERREDGHGRLSADFADNVALLGLQVDALVGLIERPALGQELRRIGDGDQQARGFRAHLVLAGFTGRDRHDIKPPIVLLWHAPGVALRQQPFAEDRELALDGVHNAVDLALVRVRDDSRLPDCLRHKRHGILLKKVLATAHRVNERLHGVRHAGHIRRADSRVSEQHYILAIVTNESVEQLGLSKGRKALALIKASFVNLTPAKDAAPQQRNCFRGVIKQRVDAERNCEVLLDIGFGKTMTVVTPRSRVEDLGLKEGDAALATFDPSDVILAVE